MIPVRDTLEARGPVPATLGLIVAYFVLALVGDIPHLNFWQVLVCLAGLWLFGAYPERRLGSPAFLAFFVLVAGVSGFLVGAIDESSSGYAISLFIPVLCTAGLHLALAPKSKTLSLLIVPFGSTFFEVPTYIIAIIWLVLEILLFAV